MIPKIISNGVRQIKYFLRKRQLQNRYRIFWAIFHYLENLWKFHSLRRLINFSQYRLKKHIGGAEDLWIGKRINNGVFYLLKKSELSGASRIIKIPRFDNQYSTELWKRIQKKDDWAQYEELLKNLSHDPIWGKHFPAVHTVHRDGGYESDLVPGANMSDIRSALRSNVPLPNGVDGKSLIAAINELLIHIKLAVGKKGMLFGDWAPYNLIYNPASRTIFNVDLEGMFLYNPDRVEAKIEYIEAELRSFETVLKLRERNNSESRAVLDTIVVLTRINEKGTAYSGNAFFAGYHTISLKGHALNGQRKCQWRLSKIPINFSAKNVLDIGCNSGGMLHALADKIAFGVGVDREPLAISAARQIALLNERDNLKFNVFDIEHDDLSLLNSFFPDGVIDICLLLSVFLWIGNGREVAAFAARAAKTTLAETNGSPLQQTQQEKWLQSAFRSVEKLDPASLDDFQQSKRVLYLCS